MEAFSPNFHLELKKFHSALKRYLGKKVKHQKRDAKTAKRGIFFRERWLKAKWIH
jgi:hypothetical protein